MYAKVNFGRNAYVLCATLAPSRELMAKFGVDSAIVIHDPDGFAEAIATQVPGFLGGADGPCSYQSNRTILRDGGYQDWAVKAPIDRARAHKFLEQLMGVHPYFLKHHDYLAQNEWRFVWESSEPLREHIDIVVPEARKFCSAWSNYVDGFAF